MEKKIYPPTQDDFWSEVGSLAYNTFHVGQICGACLGVVWRFRQTTFYFGSLRVKIILACQQVLNEFGPQWTEMGCSSFNFKHYLQACTITSRKTLLVLYAKQPMKKHERDKNINKKSHLVMTFELVNNM